MMIVDKKKFPKFVIISIDADSKAKFSIKVWVSDLEKEREGERHTNEKDH